MTTFNDYVIESLMEAYSAPYGKHGSRGNPSPILPAARAVFNKNKVTPDHSHSKEGGAWHEGDGHVRTYVSHHDKWGPEGHSTVKKHFHVASSGHYHPDKDHTKIGEQEHFSHDQSQKRLHPGHLVGVSNYTNGKKVNHHGEDHSKTAAPLHVYK